MNKLLKIGIVVAALVLVDLILPEPLMWGWGLIMLVVLVRLTRHDEKPRKSRLVIGFIVAILMLTSSYVAGYYANYAYYHTTNSDVLGTLAVYLQLLHVIFDVGLVTFGFLLVLTYRYLHYPRQ